MGSFVPLRTILTILVCVFAVIEACPKVVQILCRCDDLHNGVSLNCSDSNAADVVQILKENQASLGLIQTLTMQRANIKKVPAGFLSGLYIKKLDMSYNHMEELDDRAFAGMSPVLQELILNHNNLTHVPVLALGALKTLLKLDLSNNTIGDIRAEDVFPNLPKLFDVNLAYNKICNVHKSAFESIKNSVQAINLGHNCLKGIPAPAIRGFKQLMALHMHRNQIEMLENLAFMNLPVLNLLNLAGNKITEIRPQAFLNVPNLRYLYLTENKVTALSEHQFSAFAQLEMLDLTGNFIESIPEYTFSNLQQLRQLYLGSNRISKIEHNAFINSTIVILQLSGNKLTEITDGQLKNLPGLQQISFKDNQIKTIHPNAFYDIPSLVMIDLSQNEIAELPPSTFMAQLNLLLIDLSKNKIIRTPYAAFNRRVGTVLLQENPLVCTEKIHMLQDGAGIYIPNSEDIICGGTPRPKGPHVVSTTTEQPDEPSPFKQDNSHQLSIRPVHISKIDQEATETEGLAPSSKIPLAKAMPGGDLIPVRPVNAPTESTSGSRSITRSRGGLTGSDIAHRVNIETASEEDEEEDTEEGTETEMEDGADNNNEESKVENTDMPRTSHENPIRLAPILPARGDAPSDGAPSNPNQNTAMRTSTLGPRVYTDIADNPNIIHPFPVPFLKRGPIMSKAGRVSNRPSESNETTNKPQPTLPPSIVVAPARHIPTSSEVAANKIEDEKFEEFKLEARTNEPNEVAAEAPYDADGNRSSNLAKMATPTTIIVVCLSTVAIVLISVFIGLCVARHRTLHRLSSSCSDSTTARTNAYVAAQTAQMNMIYGTMDRNRTMSLSRHEENAQPWIYTPGPAYSHYYK